MAREGAISNLGLAEIFFVVKKSHDPFCDSHPHTASDYKSFFAFENREYQNRKDVDPGKVEKRVLGQCVGHAIEAWSRQFRVFYFSVLVVGSRARLFRWDRAGAIVTEAFDLRSQPGLLCEFLWRFHLANPVQRGLDPTVVVASRAEEDLFKKLITKHAAIQLGISEDDNEKLKNALSQNYEERKVTKVEVYVRDHPKPDFHLISVPLACPRSISGHSTRAYWSVKLTGENEGIVCFLKDSWRLDIDSVSNEGSIYEEMESAKVENICDLERYGDVPVSQTGLCGCDVENAREDGHAVSSSSKVHPQSHSVLSQQTRTHEFIDAYWVCECLRNGLEDRIFRHIHSRIVLGQAGYSLRTFSGSRELFGAAQDVLEGTIPLFV